MTARKMELTSTKRNIVHENLSRTFSKCMAALRSVLLAGLQGDNTHIFH